MDQHSNENFIYLGSAVISTNSSDLEVERRIQAATKSFRSLRQRLWSRDYIKRTTKVKVYNAAVLPPLHYSTECIILQRRHTNKFTRTQLRHQHQTLRTHWQDRVPDVKVLRRANTPSAEALITASQLLWANHVRHTSDCRHPIVVLYGELSEGRRKRGGQKLRFKDVLKRHMKNTVISPDPWNKLPPIGATGEHRRGDQSKVQRRSVRRNTNEFMKDDTLNNNRARMQCLWTALQITCRSCGPSARM